MAPSTYLGIPLRKRWEESIVYDARHPNMLVDIYTAGDYGCIIHWHGLRLMV